MNIQRIIIFFMILGLFFGCKSKLEITDTLEAASLQYFSFEQQKNTQLTTDITATIEGQNVDFSVPDIDLTALKPSFTYIGTAISVAGQPQVSGQSAQDFSAPVQYDILGQDGKVVSYSIRPHIQAENLTFESFIFEKSNNIQLTQDIPLSEVDGKWTVTTTLIGSKALIPTFQTNAQKVLMGSQEITSGQSTIDFSGEVTLTLVSINGLEQQINIKPIWKSAIPHIYITTEGNAAIDSKDTYREGNIEIDGADVYPDFEASTEIRGRGNSTWSYAKKPYRVRLEKSASLFGLGKARNWVLLANYLDETLMLNSIALKTGQLLGIPYTNHFIPVDLTINGDYKGSYLFTEHVQANPNRVDVEEEGGMLLELDTYYDEEYRFRSTQYNLPVNIKFPELNNQSEVATIQTQFQQFEDLLTTASGFPNNNYLDYFDKETLVKFLMVFALADNGEINHPKSVFMHRKPGEKFTMGPIWDFDWAYGFDSGQTRHFKTAETPPFRSGSEIGTLFFRRFIEDPQVKSLYKATWADFKATKLPLLLAFIDEYAELIKDSHAADYNKNKNIYPNWRQTENTYDADISKLKNYMNNRIIYLDGYINNL